MGNRSVYQDRLGTHTHIGKALKKTRVRQAEALALQHQNMAVWESEIKPHVTDEILADKIDASVQYVQFKALG
eukprot:COSAG06_NODE_613_length_13796_cov_45.631525_4_plen_73_part_00